jgi:hypothetical protein
MGTGAIVRRRLHNLSICFYSSAAADDSRLFSINAADSSRGRRCLHYMAPLQTLSFVSSRKTPVCEEYNCNILYQSNEYTQLKSHKNQASYLFLYYIMCLLDDSDFCTIYLRVVAWIRFHRCHQCLLLLLSQHKSICGWAHISSDSSRILRLLIRRNQLKNDQVCIRRDKMTQDEIRPAPSGVHSTTSDCGQSARLDWCVLISN